MSAQAPPLKISTDRVVVYGLALALAASLPFILFPEWFREVAYRGDFANFWSAGANAGTRALLDSAALRAWQSAHGITPQLFVYPPAFAWLYAPLRNLAPLPAMFVADAGAIAVFAVAALVASRVYGFPRWFALVAVFAWGPVMNAWEVGQNTGLSLLLIFAATLAMLRGRSALAGVAIGLLLYKPSVALPFVVVLLARREWRAVAVVLAMAAVWYAASAVAAGGDWSWPQTYVRFVAQTNAGEFAGNAYKAYTIPTLLLAGGLPATVAYGAAAAVFVAALPLLARVPTLEAFSLTPAVGLATSIHSWPYEAALLLPAIFYAMRRLASPEREQVVFFAYIIAALALVVPFAGHALAILSIGTALWWMGARYAKGAGYESYAANSS